MSFRKWCAAVSFVALLAGGCGDGSKQATPEEMEKAKEAFGPNYKLEMSEPEPEKPGQNP